MKFCLDLMKLQRQSDATATRAVSSFPVNHLLSNEVFGLLNDRGEYETHEVHSEDFVSTSSPAAVLTAFVA